MQGAAPHLYRMTDNMEPIAPALREATPRARGIFPADGWLAPPIAVPILLSLLIVARAIWVI